MEVWLWGGYRMFLFGHWFNCFNNEALRCLALGNHIKYEWFNLYAGGILLKWNLQPTRRSAWSLAPPLPMPLVGTPVVLRIEFFIFSFSARGLKHHLKDLNRPLRVLTDCWGLSCHIFFDLNTSTKKLPIWSSILGSGAEAPTVALHLMFGKDFINHLPGTYTSQLCSIFQDSFWFTDSQQGLRVTAPKAPKSTSDQTTPRQSQSLKSECFLCWAFCLSLIRGWTLMSSLERLTNLSTRQDKKNNFWLK